MGGLNRPLYDATRIEYDTAQTKQNYITDGSDKEMGWSEGEMADDG